MVFMPDTTIIQVPELRPHIGDPGWAVIDCRFSLSDAEKGRRDYLDAHIPGAVSAPCEQNLTPEGFFLAPGELRRRFAGLIKSVPSENVICYCGSGIAAAHNLIAMAYAGLGMGRLYAGSWSDWITDPSRPIASGTE